MLESRRLLEMGNRVHWYMVFISLFLIAFYFVCLQAEVAHSYILFLSIIINFVLDFSYFFCVWIIIFSLSTFYHDRIFPVRPFVLSFVRLCMIIGLDCIFSIADKIVRGGFTI